MNRQIKITNYLAQGKTKIQKLFCIGALCATTLSVGAVAAELQPYEKLSKQLTIMNSIFVSSLKAHPDKLLKKTKVDNIYLAGQGVVFTVKPKGNLPWNRHGFSFNFSNVVVPTAPVSFADSDSSFEFFSSSDDVAEQMRYTSEQQREGARQFRQQQRELAYNLRDLEREKKDLAYQLRAISKGEKNKDEKQKLVAKQKAVTKQKVELQKTRVMLVKKSKELKKQQQVNQEKKLVERNQYYQKLTNTLVETLCTYGNSLKALPKGEHISIVLKSAGNKVAKRYQDKILVLSKRDINACAMDEISAKKLLASAKSYQF